MIQKFITNIKKIYKAFIKKTFFYVGKNTICGFILPLNDRKLTSLYLLVALKVLALAKNKILFVWNFRYNYLTSMILIILSSLYKKITKYVSYQLSNNVKKSRFIKRNTARVGAVVKTNNLKCVFSLSPSGSFFYSTNILLPNKKYIYTMQKRAMHRSSRIGTHLLGHPPIRKNSALFLLEGYACHRAHTPDPTTNSQEGITNNPVFALHRKKGSVVGQHTEWTYQECKDPKCVEYICSEVCGEPKSAEKSIGHFTHSSDKATGEVSADDLSDEKRPQYARMYNNPHETASTSRDPQGDEKKTEKLQKVLTMQSDSENDEI